MHNGVQEASKKFIEEQESGYMSDNESQEFFNLLSEKLYNPHIEKSNVMRDVTDRISYSFNQANDHRNINPLEKLDLNNNELLTGVVDSLAEGALFGDFDSPTSKNMAEHVLNKVPKSAKYGVKIDSLLIFGGLSNLHPDAKKFNEKIGEHIDNIFDPDPNKFINDMVSTNKFSTNKGKHNGMNTVLDHMIGDKNRGKLLSDDSKKIISDFVNRGDHYTDADIGNFVANSINPKALHDIIKDPDNKHLVMNETNILNDQYRGSDVKYGQLLRRGIDAITGHASGESNSYLTSSKAENIKTAFKTDKLTKDKLPDDFVKSVENIHSNTQEFLSQNPDFFKVTDEPNTLMRGLDLTVTTSKTPISNGLFSTSIRDSNASKFSKLSRSNDNISINKSMLNIGKNKLELNSNLDRFLHKDIKMSEEKSIKFASNHEYEGQLGINLKFDINKLQSEKRIFAILTEGGLAHMKKKWPNVAFAGGEGEVIINT